MQDEMLLHSPGRCVQPWAVCRLAVLSMEAWNALCGPLFPALAISLTKKRRERERNEKRESYPDSEHGPEGSVAVAVTNSLARCPLCSQRPGDGANNSAQPVQRRVAAASSYLFPVVVLATSPVCIFGVTYGEASVCRKKGRT